MYFFSPAERERKELFGGVNARTFWGEHMLLAVVDIPANGVIPPHSHPHEQAEHGSCGRVDVYGRRGGAHAAREATST